jgi:AraC-like DNA-binding protein
LANLISLAESLKTRITNNFITIPSAVGSGFAWAERLPNGISIMVYSGLLNEDYNVTRKQSDEQFFLLELNEVIEPKEYSRRRLPANALTQSSVMLNDTSHPAEYMVAEGTKVSSVKFLFNKENLNSLLNQEIVEDLVNNYFPSAIKHEVLEPIDRIYRVMLDDLLVERIDHPLRLNFIQNRVLLLLEKYLLKLYNKKNIIPGKRNKDDEIARLTQIEGLLVKDFSVAPPTIDELSRISAMSPTKLKNDFKSVFGLPIYEYYQKNRMLKAKSLLLEKKYSIKEVGMMVGYSNLSHFANTFKKEFGILPSELASKDGMLVYNL